MLKLAIPVALALLTLSARAQETTDVAKLRKTADAAVATQDWTNAVATYRKLVEADPKDGKSWHMLGYSLHATGDLDAAIEVHIKATEFPAVAPIASYNVACVHALKGRNEEALTWLEKAAALGFTGASHIANDPDMDALRDLPRFKRALQRIEQNTGDSPALQVFTVSTDRKLTRFVLFGGGGSAGGASIAYGQPTWSPKDDELAQSAKFENRRWRFGKDEWTTLDASVPMTIGSTKVDAGVWYLTLERRGEEFVMAILDPAAVQQQHHRPLRRPPHHRRQGSGPGAQSQRRGRRSAHDRAAGRPQLVRARLTGSGVRPASPVGAGPTPHQQDREGREGREGRKDGEGRQEVTGAAARPPTRRRRPRAALRDAPSPTDGCGSARRSRRR